MACAAADGTRAHWAVLNWVEAITFPVDDIAGTSMGGLFARFLIPLGMKPRRIEKPHKAGLAESILGYRTP